MQRLLLARYIRVVLICLSTTIMAVDRASSFEMTNAIGMALETNPQIRESEANKEAIEFELDQARGLYLPRVDLEARAGFQRRDSASTRRVGDDNNFLTAREIGVVLTQPLFTGFRIESEVERQAYRVDAAAFRVLERSEFIGLDAIRAYLEVLRQQDLLRIANENVDYHLQKQRQINSGVRGGVLGVSDGQQAQERLIAARATLITFEEQLLNSKILFRQVIGVDPEALVVPVTAVGLLPENLDSAVSIARQSNPRLKFANADIGTAYAEYRAAQSTLYPELNLELRSRFGEDLSGVRGKDNEYSAQLVLRYRLYNGGIDTANVQEQIRRVDEARARLHRQSRDVEALVRSSWNELFNVNRRVVLLEQQLVNAVDVLRSYELEFEVGSRSLLDILDTQNSLIRTKTALTTARSAEQFAQHKVLASMGILLPSLGVAPSKDAGSYAVENANAPVVPESENMNRTPIWTTNSVLFGKRNAGN